ncbi:MAG: ribosome-binding factor A [Rhodospirillaceae bacterium]|nr:ribosome-binding factor A [Rhodospirillaceae bacterium]
MLIRIEAVVNQRQQRVAEEIRHVLANIIQRGELKDPQLMDLSVTVSEVRVSPDLKNATAFIAPLGGGSSEALATAMNRAAPFIRMRLGKELSLKYLPKVIFEADKSFDYAQKIESILAQSKSGNKNDY